MPIRDLLVTLAVFGSLIFIIKRPYIGVLVWSWLSYMNPHRLTWGFAYSLPFAQVVAFALLFSVLINKDSRKGIPINATTILWIIFIIWMTVTCIFAVYPDRAFEYYARVIKIQLMTFITIMLMTDQRKIDLLIWTIALSIGFFSIKGGIHSVLNGGIHRTYGPPGTMFGDNNAFALATLMVIPLFYYLYTLPYSKWVKQFLLAALSLSFICALCSQSRGALLAILAVLGYFWWLSKSKVITAPILILIAVLGFSFMPESWHERMASIQNFEEDGSAMSRIHAWRYSINIANDMFTGGGFASWSPETYFKYSPDFTGTFVAHSIWFNVLADHGWLGLALFVSILWITWRNLSFIIKQTKDEPEKKQIEVLAKMMKLSFVAYFSAGTFLSLSYFDLPWHFVAITVILRRIFDEKQMDSKLTPTTERSSSQHSLLRKKPA